jgi:hypothetical protein
MLDENRLLKSAGTPPGEDFLERKRAALKRLDDSLAALRTVPSGLSGECRATMQKTQQVVLKALLLDRENEQLLLKRMSAKRLEAPQVRPTLDQIQRLYKKHGASLRRED